MTPLQKKLAGAATRASPKSPLATVLERGDRGELVELPELGRAFVRLLGFKDSQDVDGEVIAEMEARGMKELTPFSATAWESERAMRTLSRVVRSPDDRTSAFGTVDEWRSVDLHVINACWQVYADVVERLAPLNADLPDGQREQIIDACKKKAATRLRAFGVNALATFLATTEWPLAISPTTKSSDGESSPESCQGGQSIGS